MLLAESAVQTATESISFVMADEETGWFQDFILETTRYALELVEQAEATLSSAERDQALHILNFALDLDPAWPVARELLRILAPKMELMGHRYDWMPFLEKGIEKAQEFSELNGVAEYQLQLGILYRLLSEFEKAKRILQTSIQNFGAVGEKKGEARGLNELAWIEHLIHDYDLATTHATHALQILENDDPERGRSFLALGMIAYYQGNLNNAVQYHHQAKAIYTTTGDLQKVAWCLQNIGLALRQKSQFEEAITYYSTAATTLETLDDKSRWSMTQIGLGATYYDAGNLLLAIDCYQRALTVAERLQDKLQMAMIVGNLALIYSAQADYESATQHFTNAIELYEQVGDKVWTLYSMEGLASCYIKQEKFHEASAILITIKEHLPQIQGLPYYEDLCQLTNNHLDFLSNKGVG